MKIDRHARQTAKKYFRACQLPNGSVNEPAMREVMQLLVQHKPRSYIAILTRLQKLIEMANEESHVTVESATPLPDQGSSVFAELAQQYGPASGTTYTVNPELLGGLRIRRGSNIWDGSVSNRLRVLSQALS